MFVRWREFICFSEWRTVSTDDMVIRFILWYRYKVIRDWWWISYCTMVTTLCGIMSHCKHCYHYLHYLLLETAMCLCLYVRWSLDLLYHFLWCYVSWNIKHSFPDACLNKYQHWINHLFTEIKPVISHWRGSTDGEWRTVVLPPCRAVTGPCLLSQLSPVTRETWWIFTSVRQKAIRVISFL